MRSGPGCDPGLRAVFSGGRDRFGAIPLPGVNNALAKLTAAGIKVCSVLLSRPALSLLMERLDWWQRADLVLCADDVARGFPLARPDPDGLPAARSGRRANVAVVTASEGGVLAARRAGARLVVGLLSDIDDAARLDRAGATHLLTDIGELPDLVTSPGRPHDREPHHRQ